MNKSTEMTCRLGFISMNFRFVASLLGISLALCCRALAEPPETPPYSRTDDVIYGRKYGMALTMDVLTPAKPNGAAILWIVSGGFFSVRAETLSPGGIAKVVPFLKRGYTVVFVMHGSAPQFEMREIVKDIHRAVRFVRTHAKERGVDPDRIGITGASAGGYLAALMGTIGTDGDANAPDPVERSSSKVQAVACFFPGTDWLNFPNPGDNVIGISERLGTVSSFRFRELDPRTKEYIFITDQGRINELLLDLSPIHHVTPRSAPMLFVFGDQDDITSIKTQGLPMAAKMKEAGVPCEIIVKPGLKHGWPGMERDSEALADWFDRYLAVPQQAASAPGKTP